MNNSNIIIASTFSSEPQILKCPYCNNFVTTKTKYKANSKTHLIALLLCVCCCWLCCCCLVPYCTSICQDVKHYCSLCNAFLGIYHND